MISREPASRILDYRLFVLTKRYLGQIPRQLWLDVRIGGPLQSSLMTVRLQKRVTYGLLGLFVTR